MKFYRFSLFILCACSLQGSEFENLIYSRPLAEVLGSTHVSGRYYFSEDDFLNEGAEEILQTGMRVFKGWLTPGYSTAYPYNSDWPKGVDSLVELIQTPYYRELLDKPFHAYAFVVGEFSKPNWKNGMDEREVALVEAENFQLAAYLLTHFANSGKTFILQNWEGDNALRSWEIDDSETYETARRGMISWLNARQDGIDRARRLYGMKGVRVVGAVEMTRTPAGRRPFDHPLVVDDVVPHTRADLYSLSTWGTRLPGDEKFILPQLDYIAGKAPASEIYGEKNIMLGEFGAYELTYTDPDKNYPENQGSAEPKIFNEASARGQLYANRKQLEYALQWGVQYALYWEVYCNGFREGVSRNTLPEDASGQRVASSEHLKGVWMIRPDGTKTPTWHYFSNMVSNKYMSDDLLDWSRVYARSPYLQKPEKTVFIGNQSDKPASLIYKVEDLSFAGVRTLKLNSADARIGLFASSNGNDWKALEMAIQSGPELDGSGWGYTYFGTQPGSIPAGSSFLKVVLPPDSADFVRLNKVIAESRSVAEDPHRRHYRFAELDGILVNGEPITGFDPVVTRYRIWHTGSDIPKLDFLLSDPRLKTSVEKTKLNDGISLITVCFPGEKARSYKVEWINE